MIHSENVNKLLSTVRTTDDGYRALASAIVVQACDDYRSARLKADKYAVMSIERFFRSPLFDNLAHGCNGDYLIRKLREEHLVELKRYFSSKRL